MASKYWIKLYHEVLDDPKMGRLPDRLWRRVIELFLIAGDLDQEGALPTVGDMAWRLRISDDELMADLDELEKIGIVTLNGSLNVVTNFSKRQSAVSDAERMRRYRDRNRFSNDDVTDDVTGSVTIRNTDTDTDTDEEIETDEETEEDVSSVSTDLQAVIDVYSALFPERRQHKATTASLQSKLRSRMKDADFREKWKASLERGGKSEWLKAQGWFDLSWFLKNDDNWQKVLAGNYSDKNNTNGKPPTTGWQIPGGAP